MWHIILMASVAATVASQTRYLITGCSRGIGLGLVEHLLSTPDNMVVATCRSPDESTGLRRLQQSYATNRLLVLPLDTTSLEGHQTLIQTLSTEHGIDSVDVFIANAGISSPNHPVDPVLTCPSEVLAPCLGYNALLLCCYVAPAELWCYYLQDWLVSSR